MRFPHVYYIKYLILSGQNVNEVCKRVELPEIPKDSLSKIKSELKSPEGFSCNDRKHSPSVEFMRKEGIYNLFFPDGPTIEAFSLLSTLEIRAGIEKLILSREEPTKVAKTINSKFDTSISGEAIERYRHYFWNPEVMKMKDWLDLYEQTGEKRQVQHILRNGPDYARHVLGFVQNIQIRESLKELASILHFDMQALKFAPEGSDKTKSLALIATSLMKIDEKLNTNDISIKKEFENFERIKIEHTKADLKGIFDIAKAGNFSGSGRELRELSSGTRVLDLDLQDDIVGGD